MKIEEVLGSSIRHEERNSQMLNAFSKYKVKDVNCIKVGKKASKSLVNSLESALKDIKSLYNDRIFQNK